MGVDNVKVEPMDVYIGTDTAQIQKITCVADVASSLNSKYFILYNGSTKNLVYMNVASAGVDPALTGYTSKAVPFAAAASASTVATAVASAISTISGFSASASGAVVTVTAAAVGYSQPAHDSQTAKTGFAFQVTQLGDLFEKVGLIDGNIEVSALSRSPVDITSHQYGATVIGQIFTGASNPEMTFNMKEVTYANYSKILRYAGGPATPTASNSTSVIGGGTYGLFGAPTFVRVVLHPIRLGVADKTNDYCFWRCTLDLDKITFSGEETITLPVKAKAFNDDTKNTSVGVWVYGDWSQSMVP